MRNSLLIFSLLFVTSCQNHIVNKNAASIFATAETQPVSSSDDAADDPAIWIHARDPQKSLILGTDKQRGLAVYNLTGQQVQFVERGRLNNVDLRQNVTLNSNASAIAVATNRTVGALDIFSISTIGTVSHIFEQPLTLSDPYGVCLFSDNKGQVFAFVNSKDGEYQQWLLNPNGEIKPSMSASFTLASQPEGCAVDDVTQTLYLGEEEYGIWKMPADASQADKRVLIDRTGQGNISADVEGMDIYRDNSTGAVYLIVSSQGDNSYAIYDIANNDRFVGSIRVDDNLSLGIDGTQETDGLAISAYALGSDYPKGLLVVQDGYNELPTENQNFKLVSWQTVMDALQLK